MASPNTTSLKQIEKYQRQKAILLLEKMTKNLFRMCRDDQYSDDQIRQKFQSVYMQFLEFDHRELYSPYHREMKQYIKKIASLLKTHHFIDRDEQLTQLNRLQKLKNMTKYKKEKHQHSWD